tara:strand:- start:7253 stop:8902 length:1650 start_codon:yes stop_codon:yes gene_type:complete
MSYRDPHQYVDTTTSQHFQNLQTTIASAFGGVAKSYAQRQKELKAENEKKEAQTKLIKKGIAKEASLLQRTLYATDNKYPEVDFGELYNPLIKEFEDLSLAVENGTSEDPAADRRRADQIYASVSGITDTLTDLVSFTEDYDIKFDNVDKPGGVYSGMNPDVTLALNIMMQKLPGKRVPRFIDNDMSKFVWDIYDDQGNLVESFSKHRLDQISKGIDEMVTTIPDNTKDFDQVKEANPNIFVRKENNKGEVLPTNEINQKFLGNKKKISVDCPENSDARKKCWAMAQDVDKYGENGIIWDQTFNTTMDGQIAQTLGTGATDKSAIALQNTQFKKVTYTIEDFINNPTFKEKYKNLKYEELPEEIRTAIDGDGHVFDFDEPLTEAEKDIFNVAYKKDFLEKNVQKQMIGPSRFDIEESGENYTKTQITKSNKVNDNWNKSQPILKKLVSSLTQGGKVQPPVKKVMAEFGKANISANPIYGEDDKLVGYELKNQLVTTKPSILLINESPESIDQAIKVASGLSSAIDPQWGSLIGNDNNTPPVPGIDGNLP